MKKKIILTVGIMCSILTMGAIGTLAKENSTKTVESNVDVTEMTDIKNIIYDKMLNTIDNFDTVQGSLVIKFSKVQQEYNIQYNVDIPNNISFEKVIAADTDIETFANREVVTQYNNLNKVFYRNNREVNTPDPVAEMDVKERMQTQGQDKVWYYRRIPEGLSYAKQSLFPQERAFGYLNDFSLWEVKEEQNIVGRKCWIIEGHLEGTYSEKLNVATYVLAIDKETGCLLKYEGYDLAGNLTDSILTTDIMFNSPIASVYKEENKYEGYKDAVLESMKKMGVIDK